MKKDSTDLVRTLGRCFPAVAALYLLFAFGTTPLPAQVVIGGITPTPSAELDVQSTTGGLLPPRLSTAQRSAIANPATGLLVFNTTLNCMEMNLGTPSVPVWSCLTIANTASAPSSTPSVCRSTALTPITHTTTRATGIGTPTGLPSGVTATWASNTITISGTPTVAGTYNYSIPLTGGLGSVQATGTITVLFNTVSAAASVPIVAINTALTPITHATTVATGIGTPSGLPAGVTASWASNTITISGTPTVLGTFNYSIPLTGGCGSVTATGTIAVEPADCGAFIVGRSATTWKKFKCHNLGALVGADPFTPDWRLNGHYYQWGRSGIAASAPTGPGTSEANSGSVSGWNATPAVGNAWDDGTKTANDPCPAGFRVPSMVEWQSVADPNLNPTRSFVGTWTESTTNYSSGTRIGSGNSGLFLPAAGWRGPGSGSLNGRGLSGRYWTSSILGTGEAAYLYCQGNPPAQISTLSINPATGMSVRCISL